MREGELNRALRSHLKSVAFTNAPKGGVRFECKGRWLAGVALSALKKRDRVLLQHLVVDICITQNDLIFTYDHRGSGVGVQVGTVNAGADR